MAWLPLAQAQATDSALDKAIAAYRGGRHDEAVPIIRDWAGTGDAEALFWLGQAYLRGQGVPFDYALAHDYFSRSARLGNDKAQNNLGLLYRDGLGVKEDKVTAHAWFSISAASSREHPLLAAMTNRDRLELDMRPDQIAEASRRVVKLSRAIRYPRPQSVSGPAVHSPTPVSSAQRAGQAGDFFVQVGLFARRGNVEAAQRLAGRHHLPLLVEEIDVSGRTFQRLRSGPYHTREEARAAMATVDEIFRVESSLVEPADSGSRTLRSE
ncbi:MAG: SPOR domain-containing protein [Alphaproteobacteria bacterium]